mmetsp:Transcript_33966/g.78583  ORF Transcript_33966/g.78583 Transcript_33966/m.78583 type:complete len:453 (-) Transcript_33966:90-1448(-)
MCPTEGLWQLKGCAPIPEDLKKIKCDCPRALGLLPRACKPVDKFKGELEAELTLGAAIKIYAGSCEIEGHFSRVALYATLAITVSLGVWCVLSGHAKKEIIGDDQTEQQADTAMNDTQHEKEVAADDKTPEPDAPKTKLEMRVHDFRKCIDAADGLHDLAKKISALPPPDLALELTPISGNIYRYWALGGKKPTWLLYVGVRFVFLIQLIAPFSIGRWACYQYEWWTSEIRFVKYHFGSFEYGFSHVLGTILQILFAYCISLHALSIVKKAAKGNSELFMLVTHLSIPEKERGPAVFFLFLDCFMTCYLTMVCLVDMVLIFTFAASPKDICFDALGLLFIFRLHEVGGDLDYISEQDFNSERIGELCHHVRNCKVLREHEKDLDEHESFRRSLMWNATELLIYLILLLIPVFQLFVADGLVRRSTGPDIGTLGTHIAEEEAQITKLLKMQGQ